jgi:hypothetical protein
MEYPRFEGLTPRLQKDLANIDFSPYEDDHEDYSAFYDSELSVCPSNKLAGYPAFSQQYETPICACGKLMDLLLTLTDHEFDVATFRRWCPIDVQEKWNALARDDNIGHENIRNPMGIDLGSGRLFVFVCRQCKGWPCQAVYQR